MPGKTDVLKLYKQLLNKSYKFDNYNFREFSKRKVRDSFRSNQNLQESEKITEFYNTGINELARLTRQTAVSQMYTFDKLVVEPLKKHH